MPFASPFKQITHSDIEFCDVGDDVGIEIRRFNGDKQRIDSQVRVWPQRRRDFLGLVLLDLCLGRLERVIVGDCQIDCLVQRNAYRSLGVRHAQDCKRNQNSS